MNTHEPRNDGKYNSKANTVCILKILQEYSDGNIILPTSRIIELMDSVYGLHVDRRTVYSSIDILQKLGYSIETYDDNGVGYCLTDKPFLFQSYIPCRKLIYIMQNKKSAHYNCTDLRRTKWFKCYILITNVFSTSPPLMFPYKIYAYPFRFPSLFVSLCLKKFFLCPIKSLPNLQR